MALSRHMLDQHHFQPRVFTPKDDFGNLLNTRGLQWHEIFNLFFPSSTAPDPFLNNEFALDNKNNSELELEVKNNKELDHELDHELDPDLESRSLTQSLPQRTTLMVGSTLVSFPFSRPRTFPALECPFDFLGCKERFEFHCEREWFSHTLSHFGQGTAKEPQPPCGLHCIICLAAFENDHGFTAWKSYMDHLAGHFRTGLTMQHAAHPDFPLIRYLWKEGVIGTSQYRTLLESPNVKGTTEQCEVIDGTLKYQAPSKSVGGLIDTEENSWQTGVSIVGAQFWDSNAHSALPSSSTSIATASTTASSHPISRRSIISSRSSIARSSITSSTPPRLQALADPLPCEYCGTMFKGRDRKTNRERHAKKHVGRNPYSCKWCKKTFDNSWNLERHKRRACATLVENGDT